MCGEMTVRISTQERSLKETFQDTSIPVDPLHDTLKTVSPSAASDLKAKPDYIRHADEQTRISIKKNDDDIMGLKSGSRESIHKTTAAATIDAQDSRDEKAERKSKQLVDDAMLIALLNSGDLDNFVAESIFGGMSDTEVAGFVSQIEDETGRSFEDYAKEILGEDMPQRRAGESEVDYNRRVLTALGDEVLNDDLTVKAGYENDPIAKFVDDHRETENAREVVRSVDAVAREHGTDEAVAQIKPQVEESYVVAGVAEAESAVDEVSDTGNTALDGHSDTDFEESSIVQEGSSFLSGFGALDTASADFSKQFDVASAPETEVSVTNAETKPSVGFEIS